MRNITLVLASASPRRKELIHWFGLPVEVMPSDADEFIDLSFAPSHIVETLALRKAFAVQRKMIDNRSNQLRWVVGSDTIVVLDGRVLGKPVNAAMAYEMLHSLQGRTHHVYTGVAILDELGDERHLQHSVTEVTFHAMTDREIQGYIDTGEPMDKAGAYGIQGKGSLFIQRIEGDYFSVMGLPVHLLYQMLLKLGVSIF
jgi:septum formation protein